MNENENIFSVDIGYGFVKAIYNTPKNRISFASVLKRTSIITNPLIGSSEDYEVEYTENNQTTFYYVGNAGLMHFGTRRWEAKDRLEINDIKVLVATAATALKVAPGSTICLGLPMSFFSHQESREQLREIFRTMKANVKMNGKEYVVNFGKIKVFAQSAGAYFSNLYTFEGAPKKDSMLDESLAFIDAGFRTLDYLYIRYNGNEHISLGEYSGSLEEHGLNRALQMTAEKAGVKTGQSITANEVEEAIFRNIVPSKLKNIDLKELYKQSKKELASEIVNELKRRWGTALDCLSMLIITGGGGEDLFEFIKEQLGDKVTLQPDASFANAIGYVVRYNISRQAKKSA